MIDDLTRQRYGVAHAWIHWQMADGEMIARSIVNLLAYLHFAGLAAPAASCGPSGPRRAWRETGGVFIRGSLK